MGLMEFPGSWCCCLTVVVSVVRVVVLLLICSVVLVLGCCCVLSSPMSCSCDPDSGLPGYLPMASKCFIPRPAASFIPPDTITLSLPSLLLPPYIASTIQCVWHWHSSSEHPATASFPLLK